MWSLIQNRSSMPRSDVLLKIDCNYSGCFNILLRLISFLNNVFLSSGFMRLAQFPRWAPTSDNKPRELFSMSECSGNGFQSTEAHASRLLQLPAGLILASLCHTPTAPTELRATPRVSALPRHLQILTTTTKKRKNRKKKGGGHKHSI